MSHQELSMHDVRYSYPGTSVQVLRDASLRVDASSRLVLLGGNGYGKSTLLGILSGAIVPDAGYVALSGSPLQYTRSGLRSHRSRVQLVLQNPDDQLFSATVAQDVSYGPLNQGLTEPQAREQVAKACRLLDIEDLADHPIHRLSFGQRKRVAIAGAVAMDPCVLLLDEPTAGLDPHAVESLLATLESLEAHHTTVVMATHDVDLAWRWAEQAVVVSQGSVIQGFAADIMTDADLLASCRLHVPTLVQMVPALRTAGLIGPSSLPRTVGDIAHAPTPKRRSQRHPHSQT